MAAMSLGIIPELEEACTPLPGELIVCWVDRDTRTLGAEDWYYGEPSAWGPWEKFPPRYSGPFAPPESPCIGDIVTVRP